MEESPDCTVSLNVSAFLPDSYVRYPAQRMALYKRIALIRTKADMEDMTDELVDRYGNLPTPAESLLWIALIRAEGIACGIRSIRQEGNAVLFTQDSLNLEVWSRLSELVHGRVRAVVGKEATIRLQLKAGEDMLRIIHKLFEKYLSISKDPG